MALEIERDLISKRTQESIKARKLARVKICRSKGSCNSKLDIYRPEIEAFINYGFTQKFIANRHKVPEATLSNWIEKNNIKKPLLK